MLPNPSPNQDDDAAHLGVPLDEVLAILKSTSLSARIEGDALIATHEHYETRVDVTSPEKRSAANGPIRAVVRITSAVPTEIQSMIDGPDKVVPLNLFAALGALMSENDTSFVGSRLTLYEAENAWNSLQLPLVVLTAMMGAEAILGGMRRALGAADQPERDTASAWTKGDLAQVDDFLSQRCLCTTGDQTLTAEFGLRDGAQSAAQGDHHTALFQLETNQPHPEVGGGLLCTLQMPHRLKDAARLREVCNRLNCLEMATEDLPPFFGAWCEGKLGGNPAYVTYLPNALHGVAGIALNTTLWSVSRARWADAALESMGVTA